MSTRDKGGTVKHEMDGREAEGDVEYDKSRPFASLPNALVVRGAEGGEVRGLIDCCYPRKNCSRVQVFL